MGIHLSSIAQINSISPELKGIRYFVYLINYNNIEDSVINDLLRTIPEMNAEFASLGNAASVSVVKNIDFANDEISWHNCFGVDAKEVCPALLVCTLPPNYFIPQLIDQRHSAHFHNDVDVPWILLSLGEGSRSAQELIETIKRVVKEVSSGGDISLFRKDRVLTATGNRPVVNGKAANPNTRLNGRDLFRRIGQRDE